MVCITETPPPAYSPSEDKDSIVSSQPEGSNIDTTMNDVCTIPYQVITKALQLSKNVFKIKRTVCFIFYRKLI